MKLTIFKTSRPATSVPKTAVNLKQDFAQKVAALRAATGRPERFVSLCACAIHDRPFSAVYERTDPARPFLLKSIHKDGDGGQGNEAIRRTAVPASEIDMTGWGCPYCPSTEAIACDMCKTTVCGGRMAVYGLPRPIFQCRNSCGARGTLSDAVTIHGAEAPKDAGATRRPNLVNHLGNQRLTAGPDLPRLGGKK